jgi:hypothetical protein
MRCFSARVKAIRIIAKTAVARGSPVLVVLSRLCLMHPIRKITSNTETTISTERIMTPTVLS